MKGKLILILGPSGSGKSALMSKLKVEYKGEHILFPMSCTTRAKRDHEVDGKSYLFVSRDEFENKIEKNGFLEWAIVHQKNYYGILMKPVMDALNEGKLVIREVDYQGWMKIKENHPEIDLITIFIVAPTIEDYKKRILARDNMSEEELNRRLESTKKELSYKKEFDYIIVNADQHFDDAYKNFMYILEVNGV